MAASPFAAKRNELLPHAISGQMSDASSELNRAESGASAAGRAPSAKSDTLRQWSSAVRWGGQVAVQWIWVLVLRCRHRRGSIPADAEA